MIVYRVEDHDGRGLWKPGFSHQWMDDRPPENPLPPPWFVEFAHVHWSVKPEMFYGCGCRTVDQLRLWFSRRELARLRFLGYGAVKMHVNRVLAESASQCLFERKKPLILGVQAVVIY